MCHIYFAWNGAAEMEQAYVVRSAGAETGPLPPVHQRRLQTGHSAAAAAWEWWKCCKPLGSSGAPTWQSAAHSQQLQEDGLLS